MTQTNAEQALSPSPTTAAQEKRQHTSFSVIDILSPTKFNGGGLSPSSRTEQSGSLHSNDQSDHEISGTFQHINPSHRQYFHLHNHIYYTTHTLAYHTVTYREFDSSWNLVFKLSLPCIFTNYWVFFNQKSTFNQDKKMYWPFLDFLQTVRTLMYQTTTWIWRTMNPSWTRMTIL